MNVADIDLRDIKRFCAELSVAGYSNGHINLCIQDINHLMAECSDYFGATSPDAPFSKLKYKPAKGAYLEADEIIRLMANAPSDSARNLFGVLAGLGLRIGEATALQWTQVDFDRGSININQSKFYSPIEKKNVLSSPKCLSIRTLPITPMARGCLLNQYKATGSSTSGLVFPSVKDENSHLSASVVHYWLKNAAKNAKINKKVSAHTLRRSILTLLAIGGVPVSAIAMFAGHASVSTTLNHYVVFDNERAMGIIRENAPFAYLAKAQKSQTTDKLLTIEANTLAKSDD